MGHRGRADVEARSVFRAGRGLVTLAVLVAGYVVATALAGDPAPVVLVGPGSLPGMFREISAHDRFATHSIEGHPDGIDATRLHEAARPVVEALVAERTLRHLDRVGTLRESRRSSTLAAEIVVAAAMGRVDTMLFDPAAGNCGVVNRAAVAASVAYGLTRA